MKTAASIAALGEVDDLSSNSFRHDFFFNYSSLVYMVGEKRAFPDMLLFKVIILTKRKA
jgi:hypothetical protein